MLCDVERSRNLRIAVTSAVILASSTLALMSGPRMNTLAQSLLGRQIDPPAAGVPDTLRSIARETSTTRGWRLADAETHPDRVHRAFLSADIEEGALVAENILRDLRRILQVYEWRQAADDNFTIRALRRASDEVLAVRSLDSLRRAYVEGQAISWSSVDAARRTATGDLVEELVRGGDDREDIYVRWGRRNQVLEARRREEAFIRHEVNLASVLGLSLLSTEIGTVETFNQDHLVSRVGARSRYQLMPEMLRRFGVHHYRLRTRAGGQIVVREERHPLLTMEPALIVARAYSNATGHEIPGVSAYHAGPYNIFRLYASFLTAEGDRYNRRSNVVAAYFWALTSGFETVSKETRFRSQSRGYVPALYGSLRATQDMEVDTSRTMRAERINIKVGRAIFLSEVLAVLNGLDEHLDWSISESAPLYERFRVLNPHMALPPGGPEAIVPEKGDIRLETLSERRVVRFFLPVGASTVLRAAGVDAVDYGAVRVYSNDTFGPLAPDEITAVDEAYHELVRSVQYFGFTEENREKLKEIVRIFEELALQRPSIYRLLQLEVARLHDRVWASREFDRLASVVRAARGRLELPAQPPEFMFGLGPPRMSIPLRDELASANAAER